MIDFSGKDAGRSLLKANDGEWFETKFVEQIWIARRKKMENYDNGARACQSLQNWLPALVITAALLKAIAEPLLNSS